MDSVPKSILIATVTKIEAQAVLSAFTALVIRSRFTHRGKTYYMLGLHDGVSVYMVQSEMGTATPGGVLLTIHQAINDLKPQAVIM